MASEMVTLLKAAAEELRAFLERALPALAPDWWPKNVVNVLTYQQQRAVEQKGIKTLSGLDLAALLRVLDQNWYDIGRKASFGPEARHYVKEMMTVRNRWAHESAEGIAAEDLYRDLDTLQRCLAVVEASPALIERVQEEKRRVHGERAARVPSGPPEKEEADVATEFQITQVVALRSDPGKTGAVVGVQPGDPENRYNVFVDGKVRSFYASQLASAAAPPPPGPVSLDRFHAHLSALQIRHPGLSTLYSLNAARIDFIPYQFRPVLKFIRADRPRLLIADGVGVGKTIEAGLILRELQARRDVRSVLIICPRPLVAERKWEVEMKRFEERFTQLDGKTLRYCVNETDLEGAWPDLHAKTIVPYSLFDEGLLYGTGQGGGNRKKRQVGLLQLDPPPRFDLVIVDEAHHIRNPETYAHKAVRFFCDNAEAVVFLTATPIQLASEELFVLLNVLRPDLVIDRESFDHMAGPNPHINRAVDAARGGAEGWQQAAVQALEAAAATAWGRNIFSHDPEFARARSLLAGRPLSAEERVALVNDLEALHTFSSLINRTRRRDIGEFTVRKPQTVTVEFTPEQRRLHDDLLETQAGILGRVRRNVHIGFMMTTIRRQAASCLFGLAPLLEEILSRHLDELAWEEADDTFSDLDLSPVDDVRDQVEDVLAQARRLPSEDPKLAALRKIVADKQGLKNNKVMVFSSFRHTLRYLLGKLEADGPRVAMVHGNTPDEERLALRKRFQLDREDPNALDVLLFSEVGCEGLDYQFCDCIVNYDLPWNPMRVEQRIGRIDRNGQKSESVLIYNLITPGTVDAEIYERCLLRIGVFNSALGGSEEILGQVAREIRDVAEDLSLTEKERAAKLQQIADNEIKLVQEQQALEDGQAELFGIRLPADRARREVESASGYWLSPRALQNLVSRYLEERCGAGREYLLGEKALRTLRLDQEGRALLLRDFQKLPRLGASVNRQWETWLKGGNPHLALTFEPSTASDHPEAALVNPLHPLVRQAAEALEPGAVVRTALAIETEAVPPGSYPFAIYQWQITGPREDLALQPITEPPELAAHVQEFLELGRSVILNPDEFPEEAAFDRLERVHHARWSEAREDHRQRAERLLSHRKESLTTSHGARMALLQEQLAQATDERIRLMRSTQIANAEADYQRRHKALDDAGSRLDVGAQAVAYGVLVATATDPETSA